MRGKMNRVKFVIYGVGYRGRRLLEYLGPSRVVAFIDKSDKLVGTRYKKIPIVSINEYKRSYFDYEIIVTPLQYKEINLELRSDGIYEYTNLIDLPSEFAGYGSQKFPECYSGIIKKYKAPCYIYGKNAFGKLLFESLEKNGNNVSWIETSRVYKKGMLFVAYDENIDKIKTRFPYLKIVDAYDYSSNLPVYYNNKITRLKGKYEDKKRCFIVATGPSLNRNDLEVLKKNKEFSISMNRIYNIEPIWYPDIYVVIDSVLMLEDAPKIRDYHAPVKIYADANLPPDDDGMVIHCVSSSPEKMPRFSEDVAQKVYGGVTVTYSCIQLAVYLGFKEIYLLGVDCNYEKTSRKNHFYNIAANDNHEHYVDGMILAYEAARQYADSHGVKIFNATRGGKLEVFERVNFDELF